MSKPFMCGDEFPIYVPSGGCECNYTLRRIDTDEYQSSYELVLNGRGIGDVINIPKDNYVDNCVLQTVTTPEVPYAGAKVGDLYLDISFVHESRHIYASLASLMGGGYKIVDELPAEGDARYIYMVDDGQGGYERYVWDAENEDWIDLGNTEIDLSNYYTKTEVDGMIQNIMLNFYPIGSIYMSVNSTDPGTLFGGTWVRIEDTFLLASGSTYPADDGTHTTATGGAASTPFTPSGTVLGRQLQEGHLPYISGSIVFRKYGSGTVDLAPSGHFTSQIITQSAQSIAAQSTNPNKASQVTYAFGGNQAHDHGFTGTEGSVATMPPYLPVYVWKRTA